MWRQTGSDHWVKTSELEKEIQAWVLPTPSREPMYFGQGAQIVVILPLNRIVFVSIFVSFFKVERNYGNLRKFIFLLSIFSDVIIWRFGKSRISQHSRLRDILGTGELRRSTKNV